MNPSCRWARQGRAASLPWVRSKQLYLKKAHYFLLQPSVSLHIQQVAGLGYALKRSFRCHTAGWREAVELGAVAH